ncbi:hypothetical protein AMATHDRAFT_2392 [Amanita thiersii Skay4041]|uniref:Uncharacterized protein n=1 Tax=Amanita thiersii Skay4041 TaxID=703135 RepID=A0A2A9NWN5_9AGAR|nr:hypothetical protein AMATHDRAFT_2392 [Amanita thiersii Skay4041]
MQTRVFAAILIASLAGFVSASPVPKNPPLDEVARTFPLPRDSDAPVAREPSPEPDPYCRWGCV